MKIKVLCKEENYQQFLEDIKNQRIEFCNEGADVLLVEPNYKKDSLIGKLGNDYVILNPEDIMYIEATSNDVICKTKEKEYFIKEKLFEVESMFYDQGFIRVSKSVVVNKKYIETIRTSINMKFVIKMKNNVKIDVTRTYYYQFKEFIGF